MKNKVKEVLFNLLKNQLDTRIKKVFDNNGLKTVYILIINPQERTQEQKENDLRNDRRTFDKLLEYEITKEEYELFKKELGGR